MKDYYKILDLPPKTSFSKIAKKHRALTNKFIDNRKDGELSTIEFELQSEAFYVLKKPNLKVIYDQLYAIKLGGTPIKRREIMKKWEMKIADAAIKGKAFGKNLAQQSDQELIKRNKKKKSWSWTNVIWNFIEVIIEAFVSLV